VKELGASVVRIPVHPVAWRERRPDQYLLLLDEAVDWCTEADLHIIIDWHSIGNLKTELFQNPMYNTSMTETLEFWRAVAQRYAGNTTVAFYEIFNEPATIYNRLGPMTWDEWKKINEEIIALIRAYDKETIPLVAGFDWAYDLTPLRINPVAAEGIGYVTHPYPDKRPKPWEPKWEEDFGFAADYFPVIATEFGFVLGKQGLADNREYGDRIIDYLEGRGISWVAWIFDPDWTPRLIESLDTTKLTESGEFFRQALRRKAKK
jgi:endoglucanase